MGPTVTKPVHLVARIIAAQLVNLAEDQADAIYTFDPRTGQGFGRCDDVTRLAANVVAVAAQYRDWSEVTDDETEQLEAINAFYDLEHLVKVARSA